MIGRIPIYIFEDFVIITEEIIGDFLLILELFLTIYLFQGYRSWCQCLLSLVPTDGIQWCPSWFDWSSPKHDV